jgi:IS1 family transposase
MKVHIMHRMNKLPAATRVQILSLLCEGSSMRSVSRLTDTSINTVSKLLVDAGRFCAGFHDDKVRGVKARRVQVDEIWSFTYAKQRTLSSAKAAPDDAGDTWTWTGIEADTKLIVSHFFGGRDGECAKAFICDLASRLANRVQLTSDGHKAYLDAVEQAFGDDVDYAMIEKLFGQSPEGQRRYSPPVIVGTRTTCCTGKPDPKHVSTSYAERQNLTMRMHMRRFTRLTNGFSKKFENHAHMVAIYAVWYNWIRIHKTLRVTPAMAAGLTDRLWSWAEIIEAMDADRPAQKRGPYKVKSG